MIEKDRVPTPDPTVLTTEQLLREMAGLRGLMEGKLDGLDGKIAARLDGMDKAIELLQTITDRLPARVDEKIAGLKGVHDEKFSSIEKQFIERDTRSDENQKASKSNVDAALVAQKEAAAEQNKTFTQTVDKSEKNIVKLIDAMGSKIDDVKSKQDRMESARDTTTTNKGERQASGNYVLAIIGAIFAAMMLALAIYGLTRPPQVVYSTPSPMAVK